MLGRRQYRIKTLQALYAYFQGGEPRIEIAEKNLFLSIEKSYELFYLQLSCLLEFIDFYSKRSEDAKHKFFPTEEEKNSTLRLAENLVILQLQQNKTLQQRIQRYKFNWADEQEILRKVFLKVRDSKEYSEYNQLESRSYDDDKDFIIKMFRKFIVRNPALISYCDEQSIYWADDYEWAATFALKALKGMTPSFTPQDSLTAILLKEDEDDPKEDQKFIADLFRKTILHSDEFATLISERTRNWEIERIALTDIILLKMALSELMFFQNIPVKVTLNEYIEISKYFSSAKSKLFINGILDKLATDLKASDKIVKVGRGLLDN